MVYHEIDLEWEGKLALGYLSNEERKKLDEFHGRINREEDDQVELVLHSVAFVMCRSLYKREPLTREELKNKAETVLNPIRAFYSRHPVTDSESDDAYNYLFSRNLIHLGENGCELTDYGIDVIKPIAIWDY